MSESKYPRTYYGYQSGITGFCYLVWHSEANDCDVPAPEGDYVRESDYAELRTERDRLRDVLEKIADGQDGTGWRIQSTGYAENVQRLAREALTRDDSE